MEGAAPSRATVASNGEVQRLTDYEVLRFLQLRRQVRDSSGGRDVHAALVAAGGLSALSGSGTNVMNQKEVILNRIGEVKWISKMAQRYLMGTPAALQTRDGIAQALDALRADNKDDIGSSLRLSESKKLSVSVVVLWLLHRMLCPSALETTDPFACRLGHASPAAH